MNPPKRNAENNGDNDDDIEVEPIGPGDTTYKRYDFERDAMEAKEREEREEEEREEREEEEREEREEERGKDDDQ